MEIRGTHSDIDNRQCTSWRTCSGDVRIPMAYVLRLCTFRRRTRSGDARIFLTYVRIFLAYVIWWRTYIVTTCSCDVRIFLAYVFRWCTCLPATCVSTCVFVDVRLTSTYVFYRRTHSMDVRHSAANEIRDCASGDRGFGTTHRVRRTFWIWMKKIALDSFIRP